MSRKRSPRCPERDDDPDGNAWFARAMWEALPDEKKEELKNRE